MCIGNFQKRDESPLKFRMVYRIKALKLSNLDRINVNGNFLMLLKNYISYFL